MLNYAGWGADKYIRGHGEKGTTRAWKETEALSKHFSWILSHQAQKDPSPQPFAALAPSAHRLEPKQAQIYQSKPQTIQVRQVPTRAKRSEIMTSKPRDQIMQAPNAWYPVVRTCAPNAPTKPTTICLNSLRWILISIGLVRSRPSSRFKGPQSLNLYTIVVRLLQLLRPFQITPCACGMWWICPLPLSRSTVEMMLCTLNRWCRAQSR